MRRGSVSSGVHHFAPRILPLQAPTGAKWGRNWRTSPLLKLYPSSSVRCFLCMRNSDLLAAFQQQACRTIRLLTMCRFPSIHTKSPGPKGQRILRTLLRPWLTDILPFFSVFSARRARYIHSFLSPRRDSQWFLLPHESCEPLSYTDCRRDFLRIAQLWIH